MWPTWSAQGLEVAHVRCPLCVYGTDGLGAESFLEEVSGADSPHKSCMLLPHGRRSYQSVHIDHRSGIHGDVVTWEWLDVPHLRGERSKKRFRNHHFTSVNISHCFIPFQCWMPRHWSRQTPGSSSSHLWPWLRPDDATDLGPACWSSGTSEMWAKTLEWKLLAP